MVKILGIADITCAILFLAPPFGFTVPPSPVFFFSGYLIIKGFIFFYDLASLFDIIAGFLLLATLLINLPILLIFILVSFLGVKGLMSLR